MPKATPPDLRDEGQHGRALARRYSRGVRIDPHAHDWAQVLYAVAGVMWVEAGREALIVPPQRAVWLPPGTVHAISMLSAVDMRNLYFPDRYVQHLSRSCDVFEVNGLLRELIKTLAEGEHERDHAYRRTAYRLAVMELSHARRHTLRVPLPDKSDRRLTQLCESVIANPSADVSFEQHAAAAGASSRTLSRLFQRELGLGFSEWRRQVQLAIAMSQLAEGEPVSRVARSLGYLPSSFSDMFRREFGVPPTEFRPQDTLRVSDGHSGTDTAPGAPGGTDLPEV
jgi:AraC-like DNA-binding protein